MYTHITPSGLLCTLLFLECIGAANRVVSLIFVDISNRPYQYFTIFSGIDFLMSGANDNNCCEFPYTSCSVLCYYRNIAMVLTCLG